MAEGSPPSAETRRIGLPGLAEKTIVPLVVPGASERQRNSRAASVFTDPLSISIRFSLLSAKNAMDRLSGDQNGEIACSVPARAWARVVPSGRTHNCVRRSEKPGKATFHPSGEIASDISTVVRGVVISRRISRTKGWTKSNENGEGSR